MLCYVQCSSKGGTYLKKTTTNKTEYKRKPKTPLVSPPNNENISIFIVPIVYGVLSEFFEGCCCGFVVCLQPVLLSCQTGDCVPRYFFLSLSFLNKQWSFAVKSETFPSFTHALCICTWLPEAAHGVHCRQIVDEFISRAHLSCYELITISLKLKECTYN